MSASNDRQTIAEPQTLVVLNPGHFHAALTLRYANPRLHDDVFVYADAGPDLERFVEIVRSFNSRNEAPTRWRLHLTTGPDHLERLLEERRGRIVIVAGRNDTKMASIARLHDAGFYVLGDKPWVIDAEQLPLMQQTLATAPMAMDIMTERHETANRLQRALVRDVEVFGTFRTSGREPAIEMRSVHHLYKLVNGQPLRRPLWYFDTGVQGEGMTDVNTHLIDLAQWMTGDDVALDYARDVEIVSARQWPTRIPREVFERITGAADFPPPSRAHVVGGALEYLCNAELEFRLRGVPVRVESVWDLAIPQNGGDTHDAILRGTLADLVIEQSAATKFLTELTVRPLTAMTEAELRLTAAVERLQEEFPGVSLAPAENGYRIAIPERLRTTHEQNFAAVLDAFLRHVDGAPLSTTALADLRAKYTLLAEARARSRLED